MRKNTYLIVIIIFVIFTLSACMYPSKYKWKVCSQANTKWVSADGTIVFYVNDSHKATGTMHVNGEIIDIYMAEGPLRSEEMHIYPISVLQHEVISENDKYEFWICSYKSERKFIASVEKTTFYETGKKITFHRVDNSTG